MNLEVLVSCMHQNDDSLLKSTKITGNAVVINQCDNQGYAEYMTEFGKARMFSTTERGLTKSRNMAIKNSVADICVLCDDDEVFVSDYEANILNAYSEVPQADVIIFKMVGRKSSFSDKIQPLKFPKTMKVSSWQISFRKESLVKANVMFDELLGAGTGNGAEEELKFLLDCQKNGLKIFYVPVEIASVGQTKSTWFKGYDAQFFINRGATTRYILGLFLSSLYAIYYVICKRSLYSDDVKPTKALLYIFKGIKENKITKQAKSLLERV